MQGSRRPRGAPTDLERGESVNRPEFFVDRWDLPAIAGEVIMGLRRGAGQLRPARRSMNRCCRSRGVDMGVDNLVVLEAGSEFGTVARVDLVRDRRP